MAQQIDSLNVASTCLWCVNRSRYNCTVDSLWRAWKAGCCAWWWRSWYYVVGHLACSNPIGFGLEDSQRVSGCRRLFKSLNIILRFQAIIEREWILAGHPFHTRCSHAAFAQGTLTGPFEAPVFLCFLDCVWQLMRQYPTSFEFSQEFLIFVAEHTYASEFGSFLGK